ncbi:hypothetical protein CR513_26493, partial [Mucuna pruriens]
MPIRDDFRDEQLLQMDISTPWFADICNFIIASQFLPEDDPYLWKCGSDQVIRRYIPDSEISLVLHFCHAVLEATIMDQLRQPGRY